MPVENLESKDGVFRMVAELSLTVNDLQKKLSSIDGFLSNMGPQVAQGFQTLGVRLDKAENRITALEPAQKDAGLTAPELAKVEEGNKLLEETSNANDQKGNENNASNV